MVPAMQWGTHPGQGEGMLRSGTQCSPCAPCITHQPSCVALLPNAAETRDKCLFSLPCREGFSRIPSVGTMSHPVLCHHCILCGSTHTCDRGVAMGLCVVMFCTACNNPYFLQEPLFLTITFTSCCTLHSKPLLTYPLVHPLVSQSVPLLQWGWGLLGMSLNWSSRTSPWAPTRPTCCVSTDAHPHPAEGHLDENTGILYAKPLLHSVA